MSLPINGSFVPPTIDTTGAATAGAMAAVESAQSAISGIMNDIASLQQQIEAVLREIAALQPPDPSQFRRQERRETGEPPNVRVETVEVFDAQAFNAKMREYQSKLAQLQSQVQGLQQQVAAKEQELAAKERDLAEAQKALQKAMEKAPQAQQQLQERLRQLQEQQAQIERQRATLEQSQEELRRAQAELTRAWQAAGLPSQDLIDGVPAGMLDFIPGGGSGLPDSLLAGDPSSWPMCRPLPAPPTFALDGRPLGISEQVWHHLPPDDQAAIVEQMQTAYAAAVAQAEAAAAAPGPVVINPELAAYLEAHPEIVTVQDLVNETYPTGEFESTCAELGLDQIQLLQFRSAKLEDWAYVRQPPPDTIPTTVEEANAYHITQFNTAPYGTDYNRYYDGSGAWSNNCGPASLAMALETMGLMPSDLNPEQKIDYTRALIFGTHNQEVEINGTTYQLYDKDTGEGSLTGYSQIVNGASALEVPANHTYGWGALDDALAAGHPLVVSGTISSGWKAEFPEEGTYGSAGDVGHFIAILGKTADGNYLVNDPMFTHGAVEMTPDQVAVFTGTNPDITVIGDAGEGEAP